MSIYENALKAIALDSLLGEAYAAMGAYHVYCSHNYAEAERNFKQGIRLSPGYDFTYFHYSVLQVARKKQPEAQELSRMAIKLNPLSVKTNVYVAQKNFYLFGQYEEALKWLDQLDRTFPNDNFCLWVRGTVLTQQGRYKEAEAAFQGRSVSSKGTNWALGYCYGKSGQTEKAREVLAYLLQRENETYVPPTFIACVYLSIGDRSRALEYIRKAREVNDYWLVYYELDPWLDSVRDSDEYRQALKVL